MRNDVLVRTTIDRAFLADGKLLVALTVLDHVHHDVAIDWSERHGRRPPRRARSAQPQPGRHPRKGLAALHGEAVHLVVA